MQRFLCYGDSLTAGYSCWGSSFTPYSNTLLNYYTERTKSETASLQIQSVGMSGWTTTQMVDGLLKSSNSDAVNFISPGLGLLLQENAVDCVILMAGTNDVGTGIATEVTVSNIQTLIDTCRQSHGAEVVVMTIPGMGAERNHEGIKNRREALNNSIRTLVNSYDSSPRVSLVDVFEALPHPADRELSPEQKELWDNDGLHFSPAGSAFLGRFVCDELIRLGLIKM